MNLSKYIRRERAAAPKIHQNAFIDEFRSGKSFRTVAPERLKIENEITGGKTYAVHRGDKIHLDDFQSNAGERLRAGEHPWNVFGSYGGPLDLPVESDKLYNPRGLSEKDVFIARLQEQAGTSNDFTQRLENIETGVPLIDIKNEQTSYETELKKLRTALNDDTLYKEEKKAIDSKHADRKSMAKEDVKSARLRKPQRATIVVEPVVRPTGAAAVAPRTPPVGAGEEKHADEGSGSDEEDVNFRTPQKGTIEYHKRLDKLEEISIMLSKPEFTEKTFNNARKLFSEADIHVSNNVKTQQGLAKVYNKRIITLENRGDIEKDKFPILDLKRRRK